MADKGPEEPVRYVFDDLTLDTGQRLVTRGENVIEVSGLTFDLLLAIVEAAPNIISSDELVEKVWSGRPASPETITQRAMMLRQALGDNAERPKYFEVVRGQGLKLLPELKNGTPKQAPPPIAVPKSPGIFIAAVVAVAALVMIGQNFFATTPTEQQESTAKIRRFSVELGDLARLGRGSGTIRSEIAVSPDGSYLVFVGATAVNGTTRLYIRALDQLDAYPIDGTEGARRPFFSPDGQWIGFDSSTGTQMQKVSIRGGLKKVLTEGHTLMFGATWSENDDIVFATTHGQGFRTGRLVKISANGGQPEELLTPEVDMAFLWPHFLPGGTHLLFTSVSGSGQIANSGNVALLSLETGEYRTLITGAYNAKYSPTGHIVYARTDTLWAVPFDLDALQISGAESPLFDGVEYNSVIGDVIYDFSDDGLLVYLLGGEANSTDTVRRTPVWVDQDGNEERINVPPASYWGPQLSPDGSKVAVTANDGANSDVWIIDLERETAGRLTFGPSFEALPLWSPDGEHIIYSTAAPDSGIFSRQANGTGSPELISKNDIAPAAVSISPDGEHLIVLDNLNNESDMYSLSLSGESFPQPFIVTPFDDDSAEISPDGRYVAYESNETGTNQIYVRTFPNPDGGRWQISSDTALEPKWHPDGSKLFFRDSQGSIAVVDVRTDPSFSAGQPRTYVTPQFSYGRYAYDVSPTDNRLLMIKGIDDSGANSSELAIESRLAIVENWFEELKRIVPTDAAQ